MVIKAMQHEGRVRGLVVLWEYAVFDLSGLVEEELTDQPGLGRVLIGRKGGSLRK
jgi:hypothetical protein